MNKKKSRLNDIIVVAILIILAFAAGSYLAINGLLRDVELAPDRGGGISFGQESEDVVYSCDDDDDCEGNDVCFRGECVPCGTAGDHCSPTGEGEAPSCCAQYNCNGDPGECVPIDR